MTLKDQGRDRKHLLLNILTTVQSAAMGQISHSIEHFLCFQNIKQNILQHTVLYRSATFNVSKIKLQVAYTQEQVPSTVVTQEHNVNVISKCNIV